MDRIVGYKKYSTCAGDTIDALAIDMYNDEGLAHRIIQFNPDYADVLVFDANIPLKLPVYDEDVSAGSSTLPPWRRE